MDTLGTRIGKDQMEKLNYVEYLSQGIGEEECNAMNQIQIVKSISN